MGPPKYQRSKRQRPKCQSIKLQGHFETAVHSVVFSPSGQLLASAAYDDNIRLWNASSGSQTAALTKHDQDVSSIAFSPDGAILASGSSVGTIKMWKVVSRTEIIAIKAHDDNIFSVAFSPDGSLLASGSLDTTVGVWDVHSKARIDIMKGHQSSVNCVAFSPNNKTIASGSSDNQVRIWQVGSGACLATLCGHRSSVRSVMFSPQGEHVVSGSDDGTITIWDTVARVSLSKLQGHSDRVTSVALSPNGQYLASGSWDKTIRIWDVASKSHRYTLRGHLDWIMCVAFSPDGSRLASASWDKSVRLWKLSNQIVTHSTGGPYSPNPYATDSQENEASSFSTSVNLTNDISSHISLASSVHIGLGGFGGVFLGSHRDGGKVALKRPHRLFDDASARRFLREVDLWCSISHPYVLTCLGMCKFGPYVYVVSPFIEHGDLHSCMTKGIQFDRVKILYEVAEALTHLHHKGITHGDIKGHNILLSHDCSALLCDFGLAKALYSMETSSETKGSGSVRWMAPELFKNASRSMASDVYSFGITIAEVLSGQAPYPNIVDNLAVMFHVVVDKGRPLKTPLATPEGRSYSTLWEAAEECWASEPKDRPIMAQVLAMLFPLAQEKH